MLFYFLVPLLLLVLIVGLFAWRGQQLYAQQQTCDALLRQFIDSGEVFFAARHTMAYLRYVFLGLLAWVAWLGAAPPVSHVALLVLAGCGVGVLVIHRRPSGITLRREEIDYFGRRLPWHRVGAMDVMATQYGSYLRLYRTPPVTVALLFLRPRPLLSIHLADVENGVALQACIRHRLDAGGVAPYCAIR